jgi:hypothetical protein
MAKTPQDFMETQVRPTLEPSHQAEGTTLNRAPDAAVRRPASLRRAVTRERARWAFPLAVLLGGPVVLAVLETTGSVDHDEKSFLFRGAAWLVLYVVAVVSALLAPAVTGQRLPRTSRPGSPPEEPPPPRTPQEPR